MAAGRSRRGGGGSPARFAAFRRTRHRTRRGPLRVAWVPVEAAGVQRPPVVVAFAIGRRVGSAVVRNRLRRRLRAALLDLGPPPGDYLLSPDPEAASLSYSDLKDLVSHALQALSPSDHPQPPLS